MFSFVKIVEYCAKLRNKDAIHILNVILGSAQGDVEEGTQLDIVELRRVFGIQLRKYKYEQQEEFRYDFLNGRHDSAFRNEDLYDTPERLTDNGRKALKLWYLCTCLTFYFVNLRGRCHIFPLLN